MLNEDEKVYKKVQVTSSTFNCDLEEALAILKKERRSGNLIISFNYGAIVGKKFERIEKA